MKSLSELVTERFGYLITAINPVIDRQNRRIRVEIPDQIEPVIEKTARKALESSGQWRWSAGGTAFVLAMKDCRVLVTIFRDGKAPSFPGYNTLSSGLSTCIEELLNPELVAYREGYEEIEIFLKETNFRLVPELGQLSWTTGCEYISANVPSHDITPVQEIWQVEITSTLSDQDGFFVYSMVNLDPSTGGIDILKVIEVDLRLYNLDEIVIRDGELGGKLDRRIELFELKDNGSLGKITAAYQGGEFIPVDNFREIRFTPVLQEVVNAFKV